MAGSLHFSASTSVKNLFGQGLVTDQIAAVFELVKNSYDADAQSVHIIFQGLQTSNPILIIDDDGTGMSLDDIETKWMVIGTDSKKKDSVSPIYKRPLNGDKGIGRFSVDRLGNYLHMEAIRRKGTEKISADFDWDLFEVESKNISEISIPYSISSIDKNVNGVRLEIRGLRDEWSESRIKDLFKNLRQFKSPFSQEDNFKIFVSAKEYNYNRREVTVEKLEDVSALWIEAEIKESNSDIIFLTINKDGLDYESTMRNTYSFGSVKAQVYFFNQGDKIRFKNRYGFRVREYGNVRLYRDNFRIYPYGEEKNDWLDIDRRMAQGFSRFFGSRDIIGYVQTTKKYNAGLKPLTNRQGLEENDAFNQLRDFIVQVCIKTLENYFFDKFKKSTNEIINKTKVEIKYAVDELDKIALEIKAENPYASRQIKGYTETIKKQQKSQLEYVQDQQELVKVYSRIAQKETFLHKIIHQSMIHVREASGAILNLMHNLTEISKEDKELLKVALQYVQDAQNLLKTVRDDVVKRRSKIDIDICKQIEKYFRENHAIFKEDSIETKVTYNENIVYRMDIGDLKAIINNLTTNAIKSLKKVNDRQRKIRVEAYQTDKFVIIKFFDNGVGIDENEREKIFDPFHSTTDGFGLGLTIIDEIAKEYNGALELITTKDVGVCFSVKLRCV